MHTPELAPNELPNLLLGETLFGPPQPLVLRDSDEATALQPLLMKLLDEPRKDVVILSQNTLDNRTTFAKWLKQHADVQQFPLYNEKTRRTLLDTMQQLGSAAGRAGNASSFIGAGSATARRSMGNRNELERLQVEGDITEELVRQQLPLPPK